MCIRSILGSLWPWKDTRSANNAQMMMVDLVIDRITRTYPNDPDAQKTALQRALREIDLTKE